MGVIVEGRSKPCAAAAKGLHFPVPVGVSILVVVTVILTGVGLSVKIGFVEVCVTVSWMKIVWLM